MTVTMAHRHNDTRCFTHPLGRHTCYPLSSERDGLARWPPRLHTLLFFLQVAEFCRFTYKLKKYFEGGRAREGGDVELAMEFLFFISLAILLDRLGG